MALSQGPGLTSSWGKALLQSNWNADPDLAPIFRHTPTGLLASDLWQLLRFLERAQDETAAENTPGSRAELDQDSIAEGQPFANKHPNQWRPNLFRAHVPLELIQGPSPADSRSQQNLRNVLNEDLVSSRVTFWRLLLCFSLFRKPSLSPVPPAAGEAPTPAAHRGAPLLPTWCFLQILTCNVRSNGF